MGSGLWPVGCLDGRLGAGSPPPAARVGAVGAIRLRQQRQRVKLPRLQLRESLLRRPLRNRLPRSRWAPRCWPGPTGWCRRPTTAAPTTAGSATPAAVAAATTCSSSTLTGRTRSSATCNAGRRRSRGASACAAGRRSGARRARATPRVRTCTSAGGGVASIDSYRGRCTSSPGAWTDQGSYGGSPGATCAWWRARRPATTATTTATAAST